MNATKTIVVPFTKKRWKSKKAAYMLEIDGAQVTPSECAKFFGVLLDSRLSFSNHLEQTAQKYRNSAQYFADLRRDHEDLIGKR